ncbi:MAG: hypothetical protein WCF67_12750 [Chitinophagaceae bacterium]
MKVLYLIVFLLLSGLISFSQAHTYVRVVSKKNFNQKIDSILNAALPLIDSVINTQAFKDGILNAKFLYSQNLSNQEILDLFLSGKEVHTSQANDTIDLILETYPDQNGDNIGTTHGSERIVSSEAYILRNGARCYAAHIIHEYCHTIGKGSAGFEHRHRVLSKKQRRQKCQSVPYIIGDLARKILSVKTCKCECEDYPQT